jgi:CheY-like chemotaxis protein
MKRIVRILLVEDDQARVQWFRAWLPKDIPLIHAGSGGRALGIIQRDCRTIAGIMLDHDLQQQAVTADDSSLSGSTVVRAILQYVSPEIPVLIHSMNPGKAAAMGTALEKSNFDVTRIPMGAMSKDAFLEWLGMVRENWVDFEQ